MLLFVQHRIIQVFSNSLAQEPPIDLKAFKNAYCQIPILSSIYSLDILS